jgi:hypothetical protein
MILAILMPAKVQRALDKFAVSPSAEQFSRDFLWADPNVATNANAKRGSGCQCLLGDLLMRRQRATHNVSLMTLPMSKWVR